MAGLEFDSGLATSLFGEIADLDAVWSDGALTVAVTGRFGVELWQITGGTPTLVTTVSVIAAPGTLPDTDLDLSNGTAELLISGGFTGGSVSVSIPLATGAQTQTPLGGPDRHPAALRWDAHGTDSYVNALAGAAGLSFSSVGAGGILTPLTGLAPADDLQLGVVSEIQQVLIGGREFLVALSTTGNQISVVELFSDGSASVTATLGAADGIPMTGASSFALATVGTTTFAIVGAAQTSSLTVLEITANGELVLTDYVTDTLNTRFEAAPSLAALSGSQIGHVIAGGADDGLSAFALTEAGRLIHLDSFADTTATALDGVSALEIVETGGEIAVFSGDQTGGVSQFTFTPAGADGVLTAPQTGGTLTGGTGDELLLGSGLDDTLNGSSGDDILFDDSGSDVLTGGAGADVFVFAEDGVVDWVSDFNPAQDQLDLTNYLGATDPAALVISGSETQMTVTLDGDTLILAAASGVVLTEEDIRAAVALSIDRPFLPTAARVLVGSEGADTLLGAAASDTIDGAGGDDLIAGEAGDDVLSGGSGNDILLGADLESGLLILPGGSPPDNLDDVFDFF